MHYTRHFTKVWGLERELGCFWTCFRSFQQWLWTKSSFPSRAFWVSPSSSYSSETVAYLWDFAWNLCDSHVPRPQRPHDEWTPDFSRAANENSVVVTNSGQKEGNRTEINDHPCDRSAFFSWIPQIHFLSFLVFFWLATDVVHSRSWHHSVCCQNKRLINSSPMCCCHITKANPIFFLDKYKSVIGHTLHTRGNETPEIKFILVRTRCSSGMHLCFGSIAKDTNS